MKFHLLKVPVRPENSFSIRHDITPFFYDQWHYHPELELLYFHKGSGTYFIGNSTHRLVPGDMFLIGANLPHMFRSDKNYYLKQSKLYTHATALHFHPDCMGKDFFELPENKTIKKMLARTSQGIKIEGETKTDILQLLADLEGSKETRRLSLFLDILYRIAISRSSSEISTTTLCPNIDEMDADRLSKIYSYIFTNFSESISLESISKIANLSIHSFCRYFKVKTKKTLSAFLLEVRVGNACKLLNETNKPIGGICYESGFNNFSNFNRYFKVLVGQTPLQYRRTYKNIE